MGPVKIFYRAAFALLALSLLQVAFVHAATDAILDEDELLTVVEISQPANAPDSSHYCFWITQERLDGSTASVSICAYELAGQPIYYAAPAVGPTDSEIIVSVVYPTIYDDSMDEEAVLGLIESLQEAPDQWGANTKQPLWRAWLDELTLIRSAQAQFWRTIRARLAGMNRPTRKLAIRRIRTDFHGSGSVGFFGHIDPSERGPCGGTEGKKSHYVTDIKTNTGVRVTGAITHTTGTLTFPSGTRSYYGYKFCPVRF